MIYYEGDKGNGLFLVLSGRVKTVKLAEDGRELMTGMFGADNYLGIQALVANEPFNDTATALEDSSLCLIPKSHLRPEKPNRAKKKKSRAEISNSS